MHPSPFKKEGFLGVRHLEQTGFYESDPLAIHKRRCRKCAKKSKKTHSSASWWADLKRVAFFRRGGTVY